MKNAILTTFFLFCLGFFAEGQLNYHVGLQYNFDDIKSMQWNLGYDFMKEEQLHFGLYTGFHIILNKNNKYDGEFTYYRFPIGFRYYFKTKPKEFKHSFFVGLSHNISPINNVSPISLTNYYNNPDIVNFGFGLTSGLKLHLPKRWEITIAGNYNFDYGSISKQNQNSTNLLFMDGGILFSLGFNFNVTSNCRNNKIDMKQITN